MSSKETHYNRKEQSAGEEGNSEKGAGRKRQPLSPERAKDRTKKNHKTKSDQPVNREERTFRPKNKDRDENRGGEKKPFERRNDGEKKSFRPDNEGKRFPKRDDKPFGRRNDGEERPFKKRDHDGGEGKRPDRRREEGDKPFGRRNDGEERPFKRRDNDGSHKPFNKDRGEDKRPERRREEGDKPFKKYVPFEDREDKSTRLAGKKPFGDRKPDNGKSFGKPGADRKSRFPVEKPAQDEKPKNPFEGEDFYEDERPFTRSRKWDEKAKEGPMTLNKYLAHSGISSRREAANIIKEGKVKVNGAVLTEPGYRVQEGDQITFDDKVMKPQKNLVYILLNKPKGFITTTEDEKGRRTVMELVANAETDRIYPIGRLDRNTTGVLLMTNDGDLTQKLSHPSYNCKKIYQVTLTEPLTKRDFDKIVAGITLEDGPIKVDALAFLEKKNEIGIEIHSGKNRIVRRIFESLGYVVEKLDRVVFAGLTKKNVSRGKWRFLTEKEVITLKHFKS